jgi:hypothetical protein
MKAIQKLLYQSMLRFEQARREVLEEVVLPCRCDRPGNHPRCESCPCLPMFEKLVRLKIATPVAEKTLPTKEVDREHSQLVRKR